MTHEETVTFRAKEISSCSGSSRGSSTTSRSRSATSLALARRVLRLREFIMKDAYSFDRDEEGLAKAFSLNEAAYHRMFERVGLEYSAVQAESGMMGGKESIDFLAPSGSGENTLVTCENGDFAADLEIARGVPRSPDFPEAHGAPREVATPGVTTIEASRSAGHRLCCHLQGDARGDDRREARSRARARGRQALRAEDGRVLESDYRLRPTRRSGHSAQAEDPSAR